MKRLLLTMIENYARLNGGGDVWYNGRFIEKWADQWILDGLAAAYSKYNRADMMDALFSTIDIFKSAAVGVALKQSLSYPDGAEIHARKIMGRLFQSGSLV